MNRTTLTLVALLIVCACAVAQPTQPAADVRTFELTPTAPPTPALKYELHYDIATDRLDGNAAQLYQDSILILGPDLRLNAQKAIDAYDAHDKGTFNSLADSLDKKGLYQELDIAARRDRCDWDVPLAEMGPQTLLPHLEPFVHGLTPWIKARALRQMEQGQIDDALKTLRVGYEMAEKVGTEPTLVSALVSLRITTQMNDALIALMSRTDSPNFYFALCEFPSRQTVFRNSLYHERRSLLHATPVLYKAMIGEPVTPDEWRTMEQEIASLNDQPALDSVKDATPQNLADAVQLYAQRHHVSAERAKAVDPVVVLGEFYVDEAIRISDDLFKWRGMPYPMALAKSSQEVDAMNKKKQGQPGNPFLPMFDVNKTIANFAKVDRQMAAMTTVEAIRSYAAANGGKLPAHLEDIAETPAPENPATGKAFEYRVEGDAAVVSAGELNAPLAYTVRVRK